jgi:hypothetical protein
MPAGFSAQIDISENTNAADQVSGIVVHFNTKTLSGRRKIAIVRSVRPMFHAPRLLDPHYSHVRLIKPNLIRPVPRHRNRPKHHPLPHLFRLAPAADVAYRRVLRLVTFNRHFGPLFHRRFRVHNLQTAAVLETG